MRRHDVRGARGRNAQSAGVMQSRRHVTEDIGEKPSERAGVTSPLRVLAWPAHSNAHRNPYQHLLYSAIERSPGVEVIEFGARELLRATRLSVFHVHWPDAFLAANGSVVFWLRLVLLKCAVLIARLRGARVIWTVHNAQREHQRNGRLMARWFWPWWAKRVDFLIFLSDSARAAAVKTIIGLASVPSAVIPHGHYRPIMGDTSIGDRPSLLRLLYFGSMTAYKRPSALVRAFAGVSDSRLILRLAGSRSLNEPDLDVDSLLKSLGPEIRDRIIYSDSHLSEDDLFAELREADLAVFPYAPVLSSGAALFALSAGCPILATSQPAFEELQRAVGPDFVTLYEGDLTPVTLEYHVKRARRLRQRVAGPPLDCFDWQAIGLQTLRAYRSFGD